MARGRRVDIDARIEAAQEQVVRAKGRYDRARAELADLLKKRDEMRKEELWDAVARSERTYDEILAMVRGPKSGD